MLSKIKNLDSEQNQNKNQSLKKESCSLMTIKILLVALIFIALGTIIIGGGYLIARYAIIPPSNTDFPIVNPIIETQCEIDSDCKLIYTGGVCTPCGSTLDEGYQCLPREEAAEISRERQRMLIDPEGPQCSICWQPFEIQHTCKCENGKCEKVKEELVEEVVIMTDKTEYEQGEMVEIAMKSNVDKEMMICRPFYIIERFDNGKWIEIKRVACPCEGNIMCRIATYFILQPDDLKEFNWNQIESWCSGPIRNSKTISSQVPVGKYRVKSLVSDTEDCGINSKNIYSNEFTIKEKSVLDLRCGEKVTGEGNCPGAWLGYEFDQNEGICIKRGVSGCSYKTPFETLEECQEVCEKKIDTSNWQTYRNEEFGFEIKYPEEWLIAKHEGIYITPPYRYLYGDCYINGCVHVVILHNPRNFDIKEFYEFYAQEENFNIRDIEAKGVVYNLYGHDEAKIEQIKINNISAVKFSNYPAIGEMITISITHKNIIVELVLKGFVYNEETTREKEKILIGIANTFKFIENQK